VGREVGAVKTTLDPLLQRAFSVAKKVRTETQIGSSTVSIASVAAELARKIFGSLSGKTVLLVGAGKMSDLTARHLIQQGCTTLLVSNRTEDRAQKIADALRTPTMTTGVIPFAQLHEQSHRADIIITSTGAGQIIQTDHARALLQLRRNRPVFFIDIAVPRDVAPAVNDIEGCFVYDIDDLQQVAAQNQAVRSREAEAAESIVSKEVARYTEHLSFTHGPADAIKRLMLDAEAARQMELSRLTVQQSFTPDQLAAVDRLTRSLTAKLLHPQIVAVRSAARDSDNPDDPIE
jgi:glutamyl-tRNA reductase